MTFTPAFYRSVAVCSIVSAITTLGLIYLPEFYQPADGFEGRMRRVDEPAYALRSWVYLVHPFITFAAALGVAVRIRALRSAAAVIGVAGFALWASNEALQQTMTLFAFDKWRARLTSRPMRQRARSFARIPLCTTVFGTRSISCCCSVSRSGTPRWASGFCVRAGE
jgi:hypothetical protein